MAVKHLDSESLQAGLVHIGESPADGGEIVMLVRRPAMNERELLEHAELHVEQGLIGDTWYLGDKNGKRHPEMQLTLINARVADLLAGGIRKYWALAGDQVYVDMDLGGANLPPGTQLQLGAAVIEVSKEPHLGCHLFGARYGQAALDLVNSEQGQALKLRGINARIIRSGSVKVGDHLHKLPA
jgi:hypothetical protein